MDEMQLHVCGSMPESDDLRIERSTYYGLWRIVLHHGGFSDLQQSAFLIGVQFCPYCGEELGDTNE